MPAITRNITIILLMLTLQGTLWAQQSKWDLPTAPKRCSVIIPSNVNLMLPTSESYQIGFFVFTNNTYVNVGSATYSSQGVMIELSYDPQGLTGYKENQPLITLVRNTNRQNEIYGIEFIYQNNQNKFLLDGIITVQGVRYATWNKVMEELLCKSNEDYELKIPYGLKPSIDFGGASIRNHQNEEGRYVIDVGDMNGGIIYSLTITSPYIQYASAAQYNYVYNFNLQTFPVELLNAHYEICPGSVLTLSATDTVTQGILTRRPVVGSSTSSLSIHTEGKYFYSYSFEKNKCTVIDTITVTYKANCDNQGYPESINPIMGQEMLFTKPEVVRVYDAAMTKVCEFNSPTIWRGTDQNGNVLIPGLYFLIHEDGATHDVTILY